MSGDEASVVLLGTGTSYGIPALGCHCRVCRDESEFRCRTCALLKCRGLNILLDCGPDIRAQMLKARVKNIDYLLITHAHGDHIYGMDDLRVFTQTKPIEVFMSAETSKDVRNRFDYAFGDTESSKKWKPQFTGHIIGTEPFNVGPISVTPIPLRHGKGMSTGYRFGNFAYLTDTNGIPEESFELLQGVELVVLDAMSQWKPPTHFSISQAMKAVARIKPKRVWFVHLDCTQPTKERVETIERKKVTMGLEDVNIEVAHDMTEISGLII